MTNKYWVQNYEEHPDLFSICETCGALIPDAFWGPKNARNIHEQWHERNRST
jgi:hypothetical protein